MGNNCSPGCCWWFMLSFFPLDVLDEIWDLIESVSEGFLTYSYANSEDLIQMLQNVASDQGLFVAGKIQSTLVISTSVISNNLLSRRENLIPVLT